MLFDFWNNYQNFYKSIIWSVTSRDKIYESGDKKTNKIALVNEPSAI